MAVLDDTPEQGLLILGDVYESLVGFANLSVLEEVLALLEDVGGELDGLSRQRILVEGSDPLVDLLHILGVRSEFLSHDPVVDLGKLLLWEAWH